MTARPSRLAAVVLSLTATATSSYAQSVAPKSAPPRIAPATVAVSAEEARLRATSARDRGDSAEAVQWYREAVRLKPDWDEGWWYLGALSYERLDSAQAARAFARFVALKPDSGPGWALRGLSEFDRKQYDAALRYLARGLSLGTVGNAEIRDAVYYHVAVLRMRLGQFSVAAEPLSVLARTRGETTQLLLACGLFVLRMAMLPADVPPAQIEIVEAAGRAGYAALGLKPEAQSRFDELLARYPTTPNLHYAYGGYLLQLGQDHADAALAAFRQELEIDPKSVYAQLEIAFELLKRGAYSEAKPHAVAAVRLAPGLFAARHALGRALVGTGDVRGGIVELEEAARLAPDSAEMHAVLARAYARAGRREDARREHEVAGRLLAARRGGSYLPGFARDETAPPPGTQH